MVSVQMDTLRLALPQEEIMAFCQRWRIDEFALFGSVLREDFGPDSDLDIMVSFSPEAGWGLLDHMQMEQELVDLLGREVDLLTRRAVERSRNWIRRREILEHGRGGGRSPRARVLQRLQHGEQMVVGRLGRDSLFNVIGEGDQADGILLLEHEVGQGSSQGGRIIELADPVGPVSHGGAAVQEKVGLQVGCLAVLLDVIAIELGIGLPVDAARVVPLGVSPVLLEFRAQALGLRRMDSHHDPVHQEPRSQVEVLHSGQHPGVEIVQALTSARSLSMMWSDEIPSAWALKLVMMRCLKMEGDTAFTSSMEAT